MLARQAGKGHEYHAGICGGHVDHFLNRLDPHLVLTAIVITVLAGLRDPYVVEGSAHDCIVVADSVGFPLDIGLAVGHCGRYAGCPRSAVSHADLNRK